MKYAIKHKSHGFLISSRNNGQRVQYSNKIADAKAYTNEAADLTILKLVKAGEKQSNFDKVLN